ncbi:MAG: hypothetical protein FJZ13_01550 [Candidatus Omnitrophica bacterium]|nr:hypothetical protein [Candidatus Omnitrophota bacterium]
MQKALRKKSRILGYIFIFYLLTFIGCATVPTGEGLATYDISGVSYLSLVSLCELDGINLDYDTFTRAAVLSREGHKISLMVGDTLVLVDGSARYLKHPPDIYRGALVVPYKFKEQILDTLFKKSYSPERAAIPLSKIRKVVIDAGHGGTDPGAIGMTGVREKDITLDISKRLSSSARSAGLEVVMTRSADRFIPLSSRVDIANRSRADLFLSIHANANRVRSLKGFEVYYISPAIDDSSRALSAARDAAPDLDNNCFAGNSLNLRATLWDMFYTASRAESIALGKAICRAIDRNLDTRILGIKAARFYVLKGVRMPAVLVEIGFLSNYDEERMLKNSYYRQKIVESIMAGIKNYDQDAAWEVGRR